MHSVTVRYLSGCALAVALFGAGAAVPAAADPAQDQKFFDLLGQKEIPPVDNANSLIATAKKACAKLDDGMPVGDLVELIRNNGFAENPLARLQPQDRITRTITQFITASVEAYCPYDRAKIASIAGFRAGRTSPRIRLVSLVATPPAGDIAPTKPLPAPVQPAPVPEAPAPIAQAPAPEQPPPPKQRPIPAPSRQPQTPEAPAPQQEAPAPAPEPGPGAGGGSAPEPETPAAPAPPGHIRLAP